MYAIIKGSEVISLCDKPRFVRDKDGIWVESDREHADKVAVGNENYGLDEIYIREVDGAEYVFGESVKLASAQTDIVDTQEALCEASGDFEQRIADQSASRHFRFQITLRQCFCRNQKIYGRCADHRRCHPL